RTRPPCATASRLKPLRPFFRAGWKACTTTNPPNPGSDLNTLKTILKPVSSLYLTVFLLLSAMLLIFAGTLAQREHGIWQVQAQYFHSWWTWVEFQNLLPFVE